MVTIKEAAASARQYCSEILGLSAEQMQAVRIEEVDSNDLEWLITLSIPDPDRAKPSWFGGNVRAYKLLAIEKLTGDVKSMKIRSIQNA